MAYQRSGARYRGPRATVRYLFPSTTPRPDRVGSSSSPTLHTVSDLANLARPPAARPTVRRRRCAPMLPGLPSLLAISPPCDCCDTLPSPTPTPTPNPTSTPTPTADCLLPCEPVSPSARLSPSVLPSALPQLLLSSAASSPSSRTASSPPDPPSTTMSPTSVAPSTT